MNILKWEELYWLFNCCYLIRWIAVRKFKGFIRQAKKEYFIQLYNRLLLPEIFQGEGGRGYLNEKDRCYLSAVMDDILLNQ